MVAVGRTQALSSYWRVERRASREADMLQALNTARSIAVALGLPDVGAISWGARSHTVSNTITLDGTFINGEGLPSDADYDVVLGMLYHEIEHKLSDYESSHKEALRFRYMPTSTPTKEFWQVLEDWYVDVRAAVRTPVGGLYIARARQAYDKPGVAQAVADALEHVVPGTPRAKVEEGLIRLLTVVLCYRQEVPVNLNPSLLGYCVRVLGKNWQEVEVAAERGQWIAREWGLLQAVLDEMLKEEEEEEEKSEDKEGDSEGTGTSPSPGTAEEGEEGEGSEGEGEGGSDEVEPDEEEEDDAGEDEDKDGEEEDEDEDSPGVGGSGEGDGEEEESEGLASGMPGEGGESDLSEEGTGDSGQEEEGEEEEGGEEPPVPFDMESIPEVKPLDENKGEVEESLAKAVQELDAGDREDFSQEILDALGAGAGRDLVPVNTNIQEHCVSLVQEEAIRALAEPYRKQLTQELDKLQVQARRYFRGEEEGRLSKTRLFRASYSQNIFEKVEKGRGKGLGVVLLLDNSSSIKGDWQGILAPVGVALSQLGHQHEVVVLGYTDTGIDLMYRKGFSGIRLGTSYPSGTPSAQALVVALAYAKRLKKASKLIIHVTDGVPNRTDGSQLPSVFQKVVAAKVQCVTICTGAGGAAAATFYPGNVRAPRLADVPGALAELLKKEFRGWR